MYVVLRQVSHSFQFLNNLTNRTWTAYFSMCKHKLRWETVYKRFKFFKDVLFEDFREAVWNIDWSIVFNFLRKAVIINICINYISKKRISNVCAEILKFWVESYQDQFFFWIYVLDDFIYFFRSCMWKIKSVSI